MCAVQRGARDAAVSFLEKAVAAAPQWPEANTQLGILHTEAGNFDLAEKCFRRAIKAAPHAASGYHNVALMFRRARQYLEAIDAEGTAVRLEPEDTCGYENLGDAYWDAGRFDEALSHHRAAVHRWRGPVDEAFFEHVWRELATRDRNDDAGAVANAWLERDPSSEYAKHCRAASRASRSAPRRRVRAAPLRRVSRELR